MNHQPLAVGTGTWTPERSVIKIHLLSVSLMHYARMMSIRPLWGSSRTPLTATHHPPGSFAEHDRL